MNKTIREASTRLLALLPSDVSFYPMSDLRRLDFPEAVADRIEVDLADALSRSVQPPVTEWADMDSPRVKQAWHGFIGAIHSDLVLPRNRAAEIVDNAVIEVVEALVMPRRRIPELLFGLARELTMEQLLDRKRYVTVHHFLVGALLRYMERKGVDRIDRATAQNLLERVDERYVADFTPLNWAQSLDPLFKLAGSRVDPDLIRDYFIDKGREGLASRFEHLGYRVERSHLIELLSRPVIDEPEPLHAPAKAKTTVPVAPADTPVPSSDPAPMEDLAPAADQPAAVHSNGNGVEESKTLLDMIFPEPAEKPVIDEMATRPLFEAIERSEAIPIYKRFEEPAAEPEEIEQTEEEPEVPEIPPVVEVPPEPPTAKRSRPTAWIDAEPSDHTLSPDAGVPIWQRFLSEVPEEEVEEEVETAQPTLFDTLAGQPLEDPSDDDENMPAPKPKPKPRKKNLKSQLKSGESEYIEQIFDGRKAAYLAALRSIEMMEDWDQAQQYIKEEILPVSQVEPFDESFVAFVDQLQAYFST